MSTDVMNPPTGEDGKFQVLCTLCEASCGMVADVENGKLRSLSPDPANPHSQGQVCVKGTAAIGLVYNKDRITTPLKAVDKLGTFEPVSWDEALEDIASRTRSIFSMYGSEAVGAYLGNPIFFSAFDFPAILSFLKTAKTRKIFGPISQDNLARIMANKYIYGNRRAMPLPDLDNCDLLISIGSNMLISNGSMMSTARIREQLDGIKKRGRVLMVDPRKTESASRYEHLSLRVGSDVWLLAAMLNVIFCRGWHDAEFLEDEVLGWEQLREAVSDITPEIAEKYCGVSSQSIVELAREFCSTPRAVVASRVGICRCEFGTLTNCLVDAVNICAGKFSREGGTMFGQSPTPMPPSGISETKSRIGGLSTLDGYFMPSVVMSGEILEPGPDRLRCMFMVAGNPINSGPGGEQLEQALKALDLFVACDYFVNESNQFADYILPATTFLERENIPMLTSKSMLTPTLQYAKAAIFPVGEARREEQIFGELMLRVFDKEPEPVENLLDQGFRAGMYGEASFDGIDGLTLEALKKRPGGIRLPVTSRQERWRKAVGHDEGKIHLWNAHLACEFKRLWSRDAPDGYLLFGRRDTRSMNSWLHNVERLVRSQKPTLLIHPKDAQAEDIEDGMRVEVSNKYGCVVVEAKLSEDIHPGCVNYPHGWGHRGGWIRAIAAGGANINLLAPNDPAAVEQISGASILEGIEVALRPVV